MSVLDAHSTYMSGDLSTRLAQLCGNPTERGSTHSSRRGFWFECKENTSKHGVHAARQLPFSISAPKRDAEDRQTTGLNIGVFLATPTGPGKVWLQSLPFSRMAGRMLAAAPQRGGGRDEGSVLDRLVRLLDGDNSF